MAIKDLIDQVRSQISSEDSEKVSVLLEQIKNEATNLIASKAAVDTEAKDRRIKNRDLESQIQGLEIERDDYKSKYESFDDAPLHKELAALREKYTGVLGNQVKSFEAFYNSVKDHPNFEKAKSKFKLPAGDNGKLDFSKLTSEEIEHNINVQSDLQQLEYFGEIKPASPATGKTIIVNGVPIPSVDELLEMKANLGSTHPKYLEGIKLRRENRTT